MPNLQGGVSEDKTGKANTQIFLCAVKDKGSDVTLFLFPFMSCPKTYKSRLCSAWKKHRSLLNIIRSNDLTKAVTQRVLFCLWCLTAYFVLLLLQITAALDQDEQARKQRLAYKVDQLISAMSLES